MQLEGGWMYAVTSSLYKEKGYVKLGKLRDYGGETGTIQYLIRRYKTALIDPEVLVMHATGDRTASEKKLFEILSNYRLSSNSEFFVFPDIGKHPDMVKNVIQYSMITAHVTPSDNPIECFNTNPIECVNANQSNAVTHEKELVKYTCRRCGYVTKQLCVFRGHLNRVRKCPDTFECGLSQSDLHKALDDELLSRQCCKLCKQKYKSAGQKHYHMKNCPILKLGIRIESLTQT